LIRVIVASFFFVTYPATGGLCFERAGEHRGLFTSLTTRMRPGNAFLAEAAVSAVNEEMQATRLPLQ
jgi:hypothetical protein